MSACRSDRPRDWCEGGGQRGARRARLAIRARTFDPSGPKPIRAGPVTFRELVAVYREWHVIAKDLASAREDEAKVALFLKRVGDGALTGIRTADIEDGCATRSSGCMSMRTGSRSPTRRWSSATKWASPCGSPPLLADAGAPRPRPHRHLGQSFKGVFLGRKVSRFFQVQLTSYLARSAGAFCSGKTVSANERPAKQGETPSDDLRRPCVAQDLQWLLAFASPWR